MGVYQSATEPEVRAKSYQHLFYQDELDRFGEAQLLGYFRKKHKIPAKVKPLITAHDHGTYTYRFEWFEVETFN